MGKTNFKNRMTDITRKQSNYKLTFTLMEEDRFLKIE